MQIKVRYEQGLKWSILNKADEVMYQFQEVQLNIAQEVVKSWCSSWLLSPEIVYVNLGEYEEDISFRDKYFDQGRSCVKV